MPKTVIFALLPTVLMMIMLQGCQPHGEEAITYFPEDPESRYLTTSTRLAFSPDNRMTWTVYSRLNHPVYLRQDYSLLYRNNRLFATFSHWERDEDDLLQKKSFNAEPGLYQSLTIHHAEVHENESIRGNDRMSADRLFVDELDGQLISFKQPASKQEASILDRFREQITRDRTRILRSAADRYHLKLSQYRILYFSDLTRVNNKLTAFFNKKTAGRITSQLWEGIYKTYQRGIQISPTRFEPALGSSMPILLITGDHLLIVIETASGETTLLKQTIS